jgi:hypothetical protein
MRWVLKETVYKRFANVLGTAAVVLVCAERAHSFAQSQPQPQPQSPSAASSPAPTLVDGEERLDFPLSRDSEAPGTSAPEGETLRESRVPLSQRYLTQFENVKTKTEACELLEGKIVTYYDVASLVRGCKQRPVQDAEFLNELVHLRKRTVVEVPARVYRLIPFGAPLTKSEYEGAAGTAGRKLSKGECEEIEGRYVTVSGMAYYLIEGCKRREFESYYDLQEHNAGKSTIVTLNPETLYRLPEGPAMKVKTAGEESILMKMDGDVKWSRLARSNRGDETKADSPDTLRAIQNTRKVDRSEVCKKFNGKIVSFYSQIFFLDDCRRRSIDGFSIRLQQKAQSHGGVIDITPDEFKALPAGKLITEAEVYKLLR